MTSNLIGKLLEPGGECGLIPVGMAGNRYICVTDSYPDATVGHEECPVTAEDHQDAADSGNPDPRFLGDLQSNEDYDDA